MEVILKDWQGKWDLGEKSGERSWGIGDRGGGGDVKTRGVFWLIKICFVSLREKIEIIKL